MGKKKDNKPSAFDMMYGGGKVGKAMKRYGVTGVKLVKPDNRGVGTKSDHKSVDDFEKELSNAAMNDYDTRRSLEAAAMAGNKKAKKMSKKGFTDAESVINAQDFFEKQHKKHGGGGAFSSAGDYAGLTHSLVAKDRAKQTAGYDQKYATKDELNDLKDVKAKSVDEQVEEAQYEPSEKIKQAKERVVGYKEGVTAGGDGDEQRTEAADSYNKYKLNLSTMN
jgi:hypothetical protein